MRKKMTMMVAVVALMVAMLAPAALAQSVDIVGDENTVTNEGDNTEYNAIAQNIIGSIGDVEQTQEGEATAEAEDDSEATAEVDQSQDFRVVQFNSALNDF